MADVVSNVFNGMFALSTAKDSKDKFNKELGNKQPYNQYDQTLNNELNVVKNKDNFMNRINPKIANKSAADMVNVLYQEKIAGDDDEDFFKDYYKTNGNYNPNEKKLDYLPYAVLGSVAVGLGAYQAIKTGNPVAPISAAVKGIKKGFEKGIVSGPKNLIKSDRIGKITLKAVKEAEKNVGQIDANAARLTHAPIPVTDHFNKAWGTTVGAGILGGLTYLGYKAGEKNRYQKNRYQNKRACEIIDEMYKEAAPVSEENRAFAKKLFSIDTSKWAPAVKEEVKPFLEHRAIEGGFKGSNREFAEKIKNNELIPFKPVQKVNAPAITNAEDTKGAFSFKGKNKDFINRLKGISEEDWNAMKIDKKATEIVSEMYKEAYAHFAGKEDFAKTLVKEDFIQNGLRAIPYTTVPIAIGYALNKNVKNDLSPVRNANNNIVNGNDKIVIEVPIDQLNKRSRKKKASEEIDVIYKEAGFGKKPPEIKPYTPMSMKEWGKHQLPREMVKATSWALFPAAVIGLTGRNIRNMGEKINNYNNEDLSPIEPGKARIIIETGKPQQNNYDYKMASEKPTSGIEKAYLNKIKKESDKKDEKKSYDFHITDKIKEKERMLE